MDMMHVQLRCQWLYLMRGGSFCTTFEVGRQKKNQNNDFLLCLNVTILLLSASNDNHKADCYWSLGYLDKRARVGEILKMIIG
jgi:hypothetical protein